MQAAPDLAQRIEFGNANETDTQGTGWFVGFSDWTQGSAGGLRHVPLDVTTTGLCVKWFAHPAGHPHGDAKPLSEGRTMSILVSPASAFRIEFSTRADFTPEASLAHTLRRHGDYVIWGAGLYHRAFGIEPACILTVRWSPVGADAGSTSS